MSAPAKSWEDWGLSVRAANLVRRTGVISLADLTLARLEDAREPGTPIRRSLREVARVLAEHGLPRVRDELDARKDKREARTVNPTPARLAKDGAVAKTIRKANDLALEIQVRADRIQDSMGYDRRDPEAVRHELEAIKRAVARLETSVERLERL